MRTANDVQRTTTPKLWGSSNGPDVDGSAANIKLLALQRARAASAWLKCLYLDNGAQSIDAGTRSTSRT